MAEKREREESGNGTNGDDNGCGFNVDAITSENSENIGSADCIGDTKNETQESSASAEDGKDDEGANDTSAVTGSASKKQKTKPTEIVVDKVSNTIKVKLTGEPEALKADEALEEFKAGIKKLRPTGFAAITRLCCKAEWDYVIELTFKSKDGLGKFFEKEATKTLHQDLVKSLGEISNTKPHVQNFVHNRWEIR